MQSRQSNQRKSKPIRGVVRKSNCGFVMRVREESMS